MSEALDRLLQATDGYLSKLREHRSSSDQDSDEFVVTSQPSLIVNGSMRNYQIEGLDWMAHLARSGVNGILADEMGLGKTLQSISIMALAKEREWEISALPHLVVCPKSTITNWAKEFAKFCPSLTTCCLIGSQEEREQVIESQIRPGAFSVLITSFDVARIEISALKKIKFGFFVLDEAHRIKNEESVLSSAVRSIAAERILLLTGTPLQNNLHELWAMLNFIMPRVFGSSSDFDSIFDSIVAEDNSDNHSAVAATLHRILRPFMLRRLKADVARDLPAKKELYVYVDLSPLQRQIYKDIILKNADSVLHASSGSVGKVRLVNTLMQLRKCCNHPYLFEGVEEGPPFKDGPHLADNSGKLAVLDKLIDRIIAQSGGDRNQILIFSQMTRMLDVLSDYLRMKQLAYCRIDGSTASSDRQSMIDDFTRPDSDKRIFLLSTRAGGLGINLVSANFVIIFDADFNPQSDLQAIDRAHRIGQKRPVTVYRFVCRNTVEEKIVEKAAKKLLIDKLVIQRGRFSGAGGAGKEDVSKDEMAQILRFGVGQLFDEANEGSSNSAKDIDALLAFSEIKTNELTESVVKFDSMILKLDNPYSINTLGGEGVGELPAEVTAAAETAAAEQAALEATAMMLDGPRERKPIIPPAPKRVIAPQKTKLAEWRAKVGGGHDYQFFDSERLDELEFMERLKPLTRGEKSEQEKLMEEGFPNFSRRCFQTITRLLEDMGDSDQTVDAIAEALPEWPREELERYVEKLFRDGKRFLGNSFMTRLLQKIKKTETRIKKIESGMAALDRKIADHLKHGREGVEDSIWLAMPVDSAVIEDGSGWTNEIDRLLLCAVHVCGYGSWSAVRQMIRAFPRTALSFQVHLKPTEEIRKRTDDLLEIVEEEFPVKEAKKSKKSISK